MFNHTDFAFNFILLIQTIFFKPQLQNKDIQEKNSTCKQPTLTFAPFYDEYESTEKNKNKKKMLRSVFILLDVCLLLCKIMYVESLHFQGAYKNLFVFFNLSSSNSPNRACMCNICYIKTHLEA